MKKLLYLLLLVLIFSCEKDEPKPDPVICKTSTETTTHPVYGTSVSVFTACGEELKAVNGKIVVVNFDNGLKLTRKTICK